MYSFRLAKYVFLEKCENYLIDYFYLRDLLNYSKHLKGILLYTS